MILTRANDMSLWTLVYGRAGELIAHWTLQIRLHLHVVGDVDGVPGDDDDSGGGPSDVDVDGGEGEGGAD